MSQDHSPAANVTENVSGRVSSSIGHYWKISPVALTSDARNTSITGSRGQNCRRWNLFCPSQLPVAHVRPENDVSDSPRRMRINLFRAQIGHLRVERRKWAPQSCGGS